MGLRILIVNSYYYPEIYGGAEISVQKLAEGLNKEGNEVFVLTTGDADITEIINGVSVFRIRPRNVVRGNKLNQNSDPVSKLSRKMMDYNNPFNYRTIEKVILSVKPQVIHTNNIKDISTTIWRVAQAQNIKIVHTIRDYYICCPKAIMSCLNDDSCPFPTVYCRMHQYLMRKQCNLVNGVTAPSEITLNTVTGMGYFNCSSKMVIPNAIDFTYDKVKEAISNKIIKNKDTIDFIYVGMLSKIKGIEWLIDSFNEITDEKVHLYIAGRGVLEDYVKEKEKANPRLHYLGFLDEEKLNACLLKMDVLVCPSIWNEPFGRVVLDAYKNGLPVIASNCGALPNLVDNYKTGIVVEKNNISDLRRAFRFYIDNEQNICYQSRFLLKKLEQYSIKNQIDKFMLLYKKIIEEC